MQALRYGGGERKDPQTSGGTLGVPQDSYVRPLPSMSLIGIYPCTMVSASRFL